MTIVDNKYYMKTAMKKGQRLVIVSGATGVIGRHYLDHYRVRGESAVIGISRTQPDLLKADLQDKEATEAAVGSLPLAGIARILYLHSIGMDKFEPVGRPQIDDDRDGIDDEVYASNVTTFLNVARPLIERTGREGIELLLCHIGSISDSYAVPFWQSFSRSKNLVRQFLRSDAHGHVKGLTLNVSSVLTGEKYGRPFADTTYWLEVEKLIECSTPCMEQFTAKQIKYGEFDFYKHSPCYSADYFSALPRLYALWQKEMGLLGKEIPQGVRI